MEPNLQKRKSIQFFQLSSGVSNPPEYEFHDMAFIFHSAHLALDLTENKTIPTSIQTKSIHAFFHFV
jgi:hypothetical protein